MAEPTGYTLHKGFRIYLPEEADFEKDGKGRYVFMSGCGGSTPGI